MSYTSVFTPGVGYTVDPIPAPAGGGGGTWGSITGTLSSQADLGAALDAKQPSDSDLDAIAALTTTPFGRGLLDDADAAAARASIGLTIDTDVVGVKAAVALTGANTLTQASHFNRHLSWTGGTTAAQALSATASAGDFVECSNDGTALLSFTGATVAAGYRLDVNPGETFQAVYSNGAWVSLTQIPAYQSPINSQSAAYTLVAADAGKTIYHPSADTTARVWTIPANASVAFPIGTVVTFDNDDGAGAITIAITTDTLVLVGTAGSTGSRTLAEGGRATAQKVSATRWRIDGNGLT